MAAKKTTTSTTAKKTTTKRTAAKKPAAKKSSGRSASAKKTTATKKTAGKKEKKMSALDAAAKVLGESKEPLRAKEIVEQMAAKGYWQSPGGKTPHATIYAAILREIQQKGKDARFQKADRGLFSLKK